MNEAPFQTRGQQRKRSKQVLVAFLSNQPPDREEDDWMFGITAVAPIRSWWRRRKSLKVEPVITKRDRVAARRQAREVAPPGLRTGHYPAGLGKFCAFLPYGNRPDIFGVRRNCPAETRDQRGIAGNRGRCMEEMCVEVVNIRWQLRRQYGSLAKAADAIRSRVASQIG